MLKVWFPCLCAVMPGTQLQEHTGSDKAWVWSTVDFAEGERKVEMFCIRFGSTESEWRHATQRLLSALQLDCTLHMMHVTLTYHTNPSWLVAWMPIRTTAVLA